MYKLNVMAWGNVDPLWNKHNVSAERMHIWQCNVNKYGIITSCKLIRENCSDLSDVQGLKRVFYNVHDLKSHVQLMELLKKEVS